LNQPVFQCGDAERPSLAVLLGDVDTPHQFGAVSLSFQSLDQSLNVALQILRIGLGGDLVYATGRPLVERFPGVIDQLLIQTSIQISKAVSLVAPCLDGYTPQEGWLALIRSNIVRCELPLRATYFRQN
jgi:hypothetical protein